MAEALFFREALVTEATLLSELAFRSKAYWGYSTEFMSACREELSVSAQIIEDQHTPVIAAIDQQDIAGFYILENLTAHQVELGAMFVEPARIGSGIGKALLEQAKQHARQLGVRKLVIQCDPHALGFYSAAGAIVVGEMESGSFSGRFLPLLEIGLNSCDSPNQIQIHDDTAHET